MRILQVIESLEFGGAEKVVVMLANELVKSHEVSVCCLKTLGPLAAELDSRIRTFCLNKQEGNDYRLPFRLSRLFRSERIDVINTHNWAVFLEGALAAKLARVPVRIHTVHGPYTDYPAAWKGQLKRWLRHTLERWLARSFNRIITVSDSIQPYLIGQIGIQPARITTVHNGIAARTIAHPPRGEQTTFITVGRLATIKNHTLLLRSFALLTRQYPQCRLIIVGDGPQRQQLEQLIRELGIGHAASILGFRSDIDELLGKADIFVLSSNYEGISIALLEAMRAGLPVIATRVGGVPETVRDRETGLLVAANDESAFLEAMLQLVSTPDLQKKFGQAGHAFFKKEFSLEQMTTRTVGIYQQSR